MQDHVTPASFVTAGVLWDTGKQILTTLHEWKMSCDAGMSDMVGWKRTLSISGLIYSVVTALGRALNHRTYQHNSVRACLCMGDVLCTLEIFSIPATNISHDNQVTKSLFPRNVLLTLISQFCIWSLCDSKAWRSWLRCNDDIKMNLRNMNWECGLDSVSSGYDICTGPCEEGNGTVHKRRGISSPEQLSASLEGLCSFKF